MVMGTRIKVEDEAVGRGNAKGTVGNDGKWHRNGEEREREEQDAGKRENESEKCSGTLDLSNIEMGKVGGGML